MPRTEPSSGFPPRSPRPRRGTMRSLVVLVAVVLFGNALIGERGLFALFRSNGELHDLSRLIDTIQAENAALQAEVQRLTAEPRRIEEIARQELGLVRPGERVLIIRGAAAEPVRP